MTISKEKIQNNKKNSVFLAGAILNNLARIVKSEDYKLYVYEKPLYKLVSNEDIEEIILNFLRDNEITDRWRSSLLTEIFKAIRASAKKVKFNNYENLICFNNVILNIETLEEISFSNDYYFTTYVDIEYNPKLKDAGNFIDFLDSTFTLDDGTKDEDTIETILYISAYIIYTKNTIEKLFYFLGDGANGKSVLIELYKMFFNKENITSMSLDALSSESGFLREGITRSRVNFATEAKSKEIDSEEIKKIVSGETITVNPKGRPALDIEPQCKLVIAANNFPYFADTSHGISRRLIMLEFKSLFTNDDTLVDPSQRIFKLIDKAYLLNKLRQEKSAILNIFIIYLQKLKNRGWIIPESKNAIETKQEYMENADVLGTWLKTNYVTHNVDEYRGLPINYIYKEYKEYYEKNVGKFLNIKSTTVGKKVKTVFRITPRNARSSVDNIVAKHYKLIKKNAL